MIDSLFSKTRSKQYNCVNLVIDYYNIIGKEVNLNIINCFLGHRMKADLSKLKKSKILNKPKDNCLVYMDNNKTSAHVGVYINNRVFHLSDSKPILQDLYIIKKMFKKVRFYEI